MLLSYLLFMIIGAWGMYLYMRGRYTKDII